MATKLMAHQSEILSILSQQDQFGILAEQGTGKTLPMLKHISTLCRYGLAVSSKVLIVAPLSALGAWKEGLSLLTEDERNALEDIVLINYDKISRGGSKAQEELWHEWDIVVLDEAHAIANRTSNRTKYFIGYNGRGKQGYVPGLNSLAKRRYILTGTLVTNGRLEDLYAPLTFLDRDIFGSYKDFRERYLKTYRPPMSNYEIVTGYRHVEELEEILSELTYRVLKSECLDLPEKFEDTILRIPLECGKIYKQAKEHYIDTDGIEIVMDNPLVTSMKLRQLASGFVIDEKSQVHTVKSKKGKYLTELVEGILPHKVVIFCSFSHSIDVACETLDKLGVKYLVQDGRTKDKDGWRKFNEDDSIKAIVIQYRSGSSGINLQSSTHTIFFEPPLSTTELSQAKDRTHRLGVKNGCNYYFLLTEGTIEEDIYNSLANETDFTVEFFARTYDTPYLFTNTVS